MPPEDQAVASLFFKDESDPSASKNDKTKGYGWNKKKRDQSKEKSPGPRSGDGYSRAK